MDTWQLWAAIKFILRIFLFLLLTLYLLVLYSFITAWFEGSSSTKETMDSLSDLHLVVIIDILANSKGGLRDLSRFLMAYKRAWILEKGHTFKKIFFRTGDAPAPWLTLHCRRIEFIMFAAQRSSEGSPLTWRTAYRRVKKSCVRPLSQKALEAAQGRIHDLLVESLDLNERIEILSNAATTSTSKITEKLIPSNLEILKERKLENEVRSYVFKNIIKESDELDVDDQKVDEEMDGFLLCGARIFLLANRSFPHCNIVGGIMDFNAGFAWEATKCNPHSSDTSELALMLMNNLECRVKLKNHAFVPHSMQKFDVLRHEENCAALVPMASRIDMSEFTVFCRNQRICDWTRENFPTAQVECAEQLSLVYGGEGESIDSEETVDSVSSNDGEDD